MMPMCINAVSKRRILNINVGIMGHVDSGKTSLARALSTTISTAALVGFIATQRRPSLLPKPTTNHQGMQDKNPQSQERGITLDLGFSSFIVPLPEHLKDAPYDDLQFTVMIMNPHPHSVHVEKTETQILAGLLDLFYLQQLRADEIMDKLLCFNCRTRT